MIYVQRADRRLQARSGQQRSWVTGFRQHAEPGVANHFGSLEGLSEHRLPPRAVAWPQTYLNTEVFTYVISGSLRYNDAEGITGTIGAGQAQASRAGHGIRRIEGNPSSSREAHYLRALIRSSTVAGQPDHQAAVSPDRAPGRQLRRLASPQRRDGELYLDQNVEILAATLEIGQTLSVAGDCQSWLHLIQGEALLGSTALAEGDGVEIRPGTGPRFRAVQATGLLLFRIGRAMAPRPARTASGSTKYELRQR